MTKSMCKPEGINYDVFISLLVDGVLNEITYIVTTDATTIKHIITIDNIEILQNNPLGFFNLSTKQLKKIYKANRLAAVERELVKQKVHVISLAGHKRILARFTNHSMFRMMQRLVALYQASLKSKLEGIKLKQLLAELKKFDNHDFATTVDFFGNNQFILNVMLEAFNGAKLLTINKLSRGIDKHHFKLRSSPDLRKYYNFPFVFVRNVRNNAIITVELYSQSDSKYAEINSQTRDFVIDGKRY